MAAARVMVVEDDVIVAADIAQRVERLGHEVVAIVHSVRDAVRVATDRLPDVILLGIVSRGEKNAVEAAHHLRREEAVPIIYLVGSAELARFGQLGLPAPLDFVLKPGDTDALRTSIELSLRLHQTQQALAITRTRLDKATHNRRTIEALADIGSWSQDLASGELDISAPCLALHGLDPQTGPSLSNLWRYVQRNDRERLEALTRRAREQGEPYQMEYRVSPPDSGERLVRAHAVVQRDDAGRPSCLIAIAQDITEQYRAQEALRESEAHASRLLQERDFILENSRDVLYYIDANGLVFYVSPVVEQLTGIPPADWKGDFRKHLLDTEATRRAVRETMDILTTGREYPPSVIEFRKKDGGILYAEVNERPIIRDGKVLGLVGVARDVTERLQVEARLRQAAVVFENTLEAIMITDPERRITAVNHAFCEITGYTETAVMGTTPDRLAAGDEPPEFREGVWNAVAAKGRWSGEMWNRRKSGEIFPAWVNASAIRDPTQRLTNYVLVMSDLSYLRESEERLGHLAHYDPLTRLPNRLLFNARLAHSIRRAEREHRNLAVMFMDLDGFKAINDTRGHLVGDRLLQEVGNRLNRSLRKQDTVARLSGDEFVVILEDIPGPRFVSDIAQKTLTHLAQPYQLNGEEVEVSASIGISVYPQDGRDGTQLVQHADAAMYRAKERGRGLFQFYTPELTELAVERIAMETALRAALRRGELVLYYQPQVSLRSGEVVGVEALLRWQHPERGMILPDSFIHLGEETGLIRPIGDWVLRTACRQARTWIDAGAKAITLSVNVSPRQLAGEKALVSSVARILEETRLPPASLVLEITENALMKNPEEAARILHGLKSLGVTIAIDDFGTGYSSMTYLRKFAVDKLKTDKSFVHDLETNANDRAITRAIIGLGHSLQIKVVAEGVESIEQQSFLRDHGCDEMQGFLFSPPLPEADCRRVLLQGHVGQPT